MSAPLAANECRRQLRYSYTDAERIEKAKSLAESLNRYASTEAELARVKKDYAARLGAIQSEVDMLNSSVLSGYELREYLCSWTYDDPRPGRKTLRKREGGEIVAEEDMTERDRQMIIEIIDAQVAAASAPAEGERLALPAPPDWPASPGQVILSADQIKEDTDFTYAQCAEWNDCLREVFLAYDHDITKRCVRPKAEASNVLGSIIDNTHDAELERMVEWLGTGPRWQIPGVEWMASEIQTYLDAVAELARQQAEAAKATQAAAKKKARSGRRASTSGTVDVPADEGSRDDAGQDSKNNL